MPTILDTIDNAIADHELSADAMRWTPDPAAVASRPALNLSILIDALEDAIGRGATPAFVILDESRRMGRRVERPSGMRRAYRAKRGRRW